MRVRPGPTEDTVALGVTFIHTPPKQRERLTHYLLSNWRTNDFKPAPPAVATPPAPSARPWTVPLQALLPVAITVAAYLAVLHGTFLWDDDRFIVQRADARPGRYPASGLPIRPRTIIR